jgi:hypothetical protein
MIIIYRKKEREKKTKGKTVYMLFTAGLRDVCVVSKILSRASFLRGGAKSKNKNKNKNKKKRKKEKKGSASLNKAHS